MEENENLQTADSQPTTATQTEPVVTDTQPVVESPTTEPPKKSKPTFLEHKYVIIALAVLVIAILGATVFLFFQNQSLKKEMSQSPLATPTPDPTASQAPNGDLADWKTYRNEEYGFSFQFPPDWEIDESIDKFDLRERVIGISASDKQGKITDATIGLIRIWKQSPEKTLDSLVKELEASGEKVNKHIVDDRDVYKTEVVAGSTITKFLYFESNNFLHQASFIIFDSPVKNQNIKVVDQILSTFEFLED